MEYNPYIYTCTSGVVNLNLAEKIDGEWDDLSCDNFKLKKPL